MAFSEKDISSIRSEGQKFKRGTSRHAHVVKIPGVNEPIEHQEEELAIPPQETVVFIGKDLELYFNKDKAILLSQLESGQQIEVEERVLNRTYKIGQVLKIIDNSRRKEPISAKIVKVEVLGKNKVKLTLIKN